METITLNPLLKWAGGKYSSGQVIERILELYEPHRDRRWVEPFVGGMGATLRIMPHQALLGDINPHLVNLYNCVKRGLIKGLEEVGAIASKEEYLQLRQAFNDRTKYRQQYDLPPSPADAILFLALNRTCWRGVCRFNQQGGFNVPWGEYKKPKLDFDFEQYQVAFRGWTFICGEFTGFPIHPQDFIYLDPPYDCEFTQYSEGGFTWRDQIRVAEWAAARPNPVVVSNAASDRIIQLYTELGFKIELVEARRSVSCKGDRTPAAEILAMRNL